MIIAIVERSSDNASEPAVFLADSIEQAHRAVFEFIQTLLPAGDINYIDDEWLADNPVPTSLHDADAISVWLDALCEATTDVWLTLYAPTRSSTTSSTYHDVRTFDDLSRKEL